jgi:predicted amidophosphoribosyltransferase
VPIKLSFVLPRVFSLSPISLQRVLEYREKKPKRIDFVVLHQGALTHESKVGRPDIVGKFAVPFPETIRALFEKGTGLDLFPSKFGDGYWRSVKDEEEFSRIQAWIAEQGTRVFLRNCLDLSIALDYNIANVECGQYTEIGELEHRAKASNDGKAVKRLSAICTEAIESLPFYEKAAFVSAVPAMSEKAFDLPTEVSSRVAKALGIQNLTPKFVFKRPKKVSLKEARVEDKWALLEKTGLRLDTQLPKNADVILIDDKYQSGTTMQFVSMKLRDAGAHHIFGISLVKTLRDTDNAS